MQLPIAEPCRSILDARPAPGRAASLYLHIPFCFHKCHYCDFYSLVDDDSRHEVFVDRLVEEIEASKSFFAPNIDTVFVGGGTPTLLSPPLWKRLLAALHAIPGWNDGPGEFTVEANPETVTDELAATLCQGGVSRVSIGCQSFNLAHLKTLERWHDPENVARSVSILRRNGIDNLNLDLIFAIPGQTVEDWIEDLHQAIALQPTHLSCYGLTYETNTPLHVRMRAGSIQPVDDAAEADMYEATMENLAAAGFVQYEISNWSRPNLPCRHNLTYWTNGNWWALGPSASGHVDGLRWKNVPRIGSYLDQRPLPPVTDVERLDANGVVGERFMLGLRLNCGIPLRQVEAMLAGSSTADRRLAIDRFVNEGLIERTEESLRLTHRGRLLANDVLSELI